MRYLKEYIHNKTGNIYFALCEVINTTNKDDGKILILYTDYVNFYVREKQEFLEKFTEK